MATTLTPSPSSNNKQWWPRLSASKESSLYNPALNLYTDISGYIGDRPHSATGAVRRPLMTSVTNPSPTSPNAFTVSSKSSSRFNLAAVIGFGSRSKKQQPVDIQDPPQQVRSLPPQKSNTTKEFNASPRHLVFSNPNLSRRVASPVSGTSRASTDGPLTPADDPSSSGLRNSYQKSLMTLTDTDPFSPPLNDRRSSAHSDKSLSRRLAQKKDGKSTKTSSRLPMSDVPKKESRDRSATLPTRVRTSNEAFEAYQPLRAVEPPWATSHQPETHSMTSPRAGSKDHSNPAKVAPSATTIRHSRSSKAALPWPQTQVATEEESSQAHQRQNSSISTSKEPLTDSRRLHAARSSSSSSASQPSTGLSSHLTINHSRPKSGSGQSTDVRHEAMPSQSGTSQANTSLTLPTHIARMSPRPPPTAGLPPTPTSLQNLEHHPLRSRSGTSASTSSVSFASSLSSLSFNSRPSPQEPPAVGAYDYPNLLDETLPVPGEDNDPAPRRDSKTGPSAGLHKEGKAKGHAPSSPTNSPTRNDYTPKPAKPALPGSRPLPTPPGISPLGGVGIKRERALSALPSSSDAPKTLRKQRSFHNTSLHAPTPSVPTLRHYSSFDPSVMPGSEDHMHSPPLPALRSPSLPLPQDTPPQPPANTSMSKRVSTGKDSITSPRRKLFGTSKHDRDRERERKHELDHVDTTVPMNASSAGLSSASGSVLGHSLSSWFDDRGSEPASASSTSPSATHEVAQHIVPPAELLRLGAAWERESERTGLRRTKSSWGSRESDTSLTSIGSSSSKHPIHSSTAKESSSPAPESSGSKLPRSASLLSKASSAPSPSRARGPPPDLTFAPSNLILPVESYTSLSPPPPRRRHRSTSRVPPQVTSCFSLPPRRTLSTTSVKSAGSMPPKGALIERKPSFLDMTSTRQSVTIDVPDLSEREEDERDSFLELSRGMDSIDTIRESVCSVDSFMQ